MALGNLGRHDQNMWQNFADYPFALVTQIFQILKRKWFAVIFVVLLGGIFGAAAYIVLQNEYSATATMIFDQTDLGGSGYGANDQANFIIVARLFIEAFESPDFLVKLGKAIGGEKAIKADRPIKTMFPKLYRQLQYYQAKINYYRFGKPQKPDPALLYPRFFRGKLVPQVEPQTGILSLTVTADNPALAKKIANTAVELFMQDELKRQRQHLEQKLANMKRLEALKPPTKKRDLRREVETQIQLNTLAEKERDYKDRINLLTSQSLQQLNSIQQLITQKQSELAQLRTNLADNHPTVIAKLREISTLDYNLSKIQNESKYELASIESRKESLREKLKKPQLTQELLRQPEELQGAFGTLGEDYFRALSTRVKNMEIEIKLLNQQIKSSQSRTRIKLLTPAPFNPDPSKEKRLRYSFVVVALVSTFFIAMIIVRELSCPYVRDDWKIQQFINKPIILEVSKKSKSIDFYEEINTTNRNLPALIGHGQSVISHPSNALASVTTGKTLLVVNSGYTDDGAFMMQALLNHCEISSGKTLFLDFNNFDPIFLLSDDERRRIANRNNSSFKDLILKNKNDMGVDYLLVPFNLKKKSVRISLLNAIKKSYSELTGRYDQIYMRGFPELFFAENRELTKFADDMIVVVDSDYTTYDQLAGTINGLNEQKVRGLAMLRA